MLRIFLILFLFFFSHLPCKSYAEQLKDDDLALKNIAKEFQGRARDGQTLMALEDVWDRVLKNNPEILQKKKMLEAASGERLIFRSRIWPDITGTIIAGRYGERNQDPAKNFAIFGGRVQEPLFEAGIPASLRFGDMALMLAEQELQAMTVKTLHEARLTFYKTLFYRGLILLNRQIEKRLNANLHNETQRQKSGLSARGSMIQAKIQVLNKRPGAAEAEENYKEALMQLDLLMGVDLGPKLSESFFPQGILSYEPVTINVKSAVDIALKNRVDLKLLRTMISRTGEQKKMAEEAFFPIIDAFIDGEFLPENVLKNKTSNSPRPGEDTKTSEVRFGSMMTWRVIDNGLTGGKTMSIQKKKENYEITLKKLEENIPRDLVKILNTLRAEEERINALQKTVNLADENLKIIEAQVAVGKSSQLDFLNAQSSFYEAKFGILKGLYEYNLALAELDRVMGRYLQYTEVSSQQKY